MIELLRQSAPEGAVDISSMTKAELLAFAQENGITGVNSSMLKADVYAVIAAAIEGV